jgi:hypothetical protein
MQKFKYFVSFPYSDVSLDVQMLDMMLSDLLETAHKLPRESAHSCIVSPLFDDLQTIFYPAKRLYAQLPGDHSLRKKYPIEILDEAIRSVERHCSF